MMTLQKAIDNTKRRSVTLLPVESVDAAVVAMLTDASKLHTHEEQEAIHGALNQFTGNFGLTNEKPGSITYSPADLSNTVRTRLQIGSVVEQDGKSYIPLAGRLTPVHTRPDNGYIVTKPIFDPLGHAHGAISYEMVLNALLTGEELTELNNGYNVKDTLTLGAWRPVKVHRFDNSGKKSINFNIYDPTPDRLRDHELFEGFTNWVTNVDNNGMIHSAALKVAEALDHEPRYTNQPISDADQGFYDQAFKSAEDKLVPLRESITKADLLHLGNL